MNYGKLKIGFLVTVFALCLYPSATFASQSDPIVTIAVDFTAQAKCTTSSSVHSPSRSESKTQTPCAPGAITTTKQVPLSQALALHEPYVFYPSSKASVSEFTQYDLQASKLVKNLTNKLHAQASPRSNANLTTSCNEATKYTWIVQWTAGNGVRYYSYVTYHFVPTQSCYVAEDESYIYAYSGGTAWYYDQYAGYRFTGGNPCRTLGTVDYNPYDFTGLGALRPGYYYEQVVADNTYCTFANTYHNDLGPLLPY